MEKGEQIVLKNGQNAIYRGKSYDGKNPHLIELVDSSQRIYVSDKDIVGQEQPKVRKIPTATIERFKAKIQELEEEKAQVFREQEYEVGGLDGGTDEFESTGQHNVYGRRLNSIDKKIETLQKKIRQLKGEPEPSYKTLSAEEFNNPVREAIELLGEITNKKVVLTEKKD